MTNANDSTIPQIGDIAPGDYNTTLYNYINKGLTKREYFAAMAMQALIYHFGVRHDENVYESTKAADALMNELNKKP